MENIKIKLFLVILFLLLSPNFVNAHSEETFEEAEKLIESGISCDELTEHQLEEIGDYYMEQIHPGEEHIRMDEMMGGEGSERLRLMHINMGRSNYCDGNDAILSGMMGNGMMQPSYGFYWFPNLIYAVLIIGLIVLIYFLIKNKK